MILLGLSFLCLMYAFPLCFSLYTHFTQDAMSHVLADDAKCNVYVMSWGITWEKILIDTVLFLLFLLLLLLVSLLRRRPVLDGIGNHVHQLRLTSQKVELVVP